jgi:hypothetical protein
MPAAVSLSFPYDHSDVIPENRPETCSRGRYHADGRPAEVFPRQNIRPRNSPQFPPKQTERDKEKRQPRRQLDRDSRKETETAGKSGQDATGKDGERQTATTGGRGPYQIIAATDGDFPADIDRSYRKRPERFPRSLNDHSRMK